MVAKRKLFYPIDEACERLGATPFDLSVLVAERHLRLSVAVAGPTVETGAVEEAEVRLSASSNRRRTRFARELADEG